MVQLRFLKKLFKEPKAIKEPRESREMLIWLLYKKKVHKVFNARAWTDFFSYPSNPNPSVDSLAHRRHENVSSITDHWLYLGANVTGVFVSHTPVSCYCQIEVPAPIRVPAQRTWNSLLSQSISDEFLNLISHKSSLSYFPVRCHSSFPLLQRNFNLPEPTEVKNFLICVVVSITSIVNCWGLQEILYQVEFPVQTLGKFPAV